MTMNRDELKTAHRERVKQAEATAIREAAILNAAAECLEIDDPLEGFDSHFPEDPIFSIAQRGHRAQFDHAGIAYTVTITPDTKRKAEAEAAHFREADAFRLGQKNALEAVQEAIGRVTVEPFSAADMIRMEAQEGE